MDAEHTISRLDLMAEIDRAEDINSQEALLFPFPCNFKFFFGSYLLIFALKALSVTNVS